MDLRIRRRQRRVESILTAVQATAINPENFKALLAFLAQLLPLLLPLLIPKANTKAYLGEINTVGDLENELNTIYAAADVSDSAEASTTNTILNAIEVFDLQTNSVEE